VWSKLIVEKINVFTGNPRVRNWNLPSRRSSSVIEKEEEEKVENLDNFSEEESFNEEDTILVEEPDVVSDIIAGFEPLTVESTSTTTSTTMTTTTTTVKPQTKAEKFSPSNSDMTNGYLFFRMLTG
jgi:hypothetical protein